MKYNPEKHHRRSIHLKGYDYSQQGGYYMTIVTQNRECLFGDLVDGEMVLNDAGTMIEKWYFELENKFPDIQCDEYVIMPNHFHAVIHNVGVDLRVCPMKKKNWANTIRLNTIRANTIRANTQVRPYGKLYNGSKR